MILAILIIFTAGYAAIALEHPLKLDKAASALITGVTCWTIYIFSSATPEGVSAQLLHHLGDIASILFFLLGAMTIVALIDSHDGFDIITAIIKTRSISKLLLIITLLTFFISALLDNLTTAIVMTSLCGKLLDDKEDIAWFAGMIIIAANAGGAWSPLGDVTTTMLWIGGQISALNIMKVLFVPSLAVAAFPALFMAYRFKGKTLKGNDTGKQIKSDSKWMLLIGVALLIFVPAFKTATHLPPFMGMLLALGLIWLATVLLHKKKTPEHVEKYTVATALQKIDTPSILFFLGILLSVACLEAVGVLKMLATFLNDSLKNDYLIGSALGLLSAIVDNVPLVAAAQGMYDLSTFPIDHPFWEFIALTTGTGGSIIIIGSAAGVAVMGIEDISFTWYLKRISLLALLGYAAGAGAYLLELA
jgi:Na+/H+ antiporter NhaD/arsenite permease-like protein